MLSITPAMQSILFAQKFNQMLTDRLQSILRQSRANICNPLHSTFLFCLGARMCSHRQCVCVCVFVSVLKAPTLNNKNGESKNEEDHTYTQKNRHCALDTQQLLCAIYCLNEPRLTAVDEQCWLN